MNCRSLVITAPARLHFGLVAFGRGYAMQFGGVGLMLDRPATRIKFSPAPRLQLHFDDRPRAREIVARWIELRSSLHSEWSDSPENLPVDVRQLDGPPAHVGLGSGTQLALSIAAGLDHWFGVTSPLTPRDAALLGRGRRSSVGSHGFFHGGLIVDRGKSSDQSVGELETSVELPADWRVVLACPRNETGPSGELEDRLFRSLAPVDPVVAGAMRRIVDASLLPAAQSGDFEAFSEALYEFGYRAGLSFGALQHGPFYGPSVSRLVGCIRSLNVRGVGQSSWGPCVFAVCRGPDQAVELVRSLTSRFPERECWIEISTINRRGHTVSESNESVIRIEEPMPGR
jgi:beta-RFAP synthase